MESVTITRIAGSGEKASVDGIGTAAAFCGLQHICYSESTNMMLIAEDDDLSRRHPSRIRCMFPATERLKSTLNSVLMESGALSIQPLISMIHDYAKTNSSCHVHRN